MSRSSQKTSRHKAAGRKLNSARIAAVTVLDAVLVRGRSLATTRALLADGLEDRRERSLAMELVNGVLRWRFRLEAILAQLLNKPLRKKDQDVQLVLLIALYELVELSTPDYAVVNEAVAQTRHLRKQWASAVVNGVLRGFIRDRHNLLARVDEHEVARFSHPQWFIELLRQDWPQQADQILEANNQRPPMWLRVNRARISADDYLELLRAQQLSATRHPVVETALMLDKPVDVGVLPGFSDGLVSVQDVAAQLAARLLAAEDGEHVLDLCAAPGGKTCHVLEHSTGIQMTAVEIEPLRMQSLQQNLDRLGLQARLVVGDATEPQSWWHGELFDRILLDAPCSASGVIRRHPDIKSLRQPGDLAALTDIQQNILQQAWGMLKPGGVLLYVTCSVLKQENQQQIERLLSAVDAEEIALEESWGIECRHGRQLFPGDLGGDGFYYARLKKRLCSLNKG
ncbi:MAG: 16S rRNA (cytosine(967)-C(5))-methyltransferase RsmB [Gammaproteobacteria bacterium]